MTYAVYADPKGESLLLVNNDMWVVNGDWKLLLKADGFYCVSPKSVDRIDIHLAGYIDYDGDYNSTLNRFRAGEGHHILHGVTAPVPEVVPELCKRKYYGIECSCSKCKGK